MRQKARRRDKARELDHVAHFEKKIFDEWPLKNGETVRVSIDHAKGYDLVHIRRWEGGTGRLYPTKKGIAVAVDHLSPLIKALKEIRAHAREIGLVLQPKRQSTHRGRK